MNNPNRVTEKPKSEIATIAPRPSALDHMANRLAIDRGNLSKVLRSTVFKEANEAEFMALCVIANELNLNPLKREIFAFPSKGGIVPMVSIDGWIAIADRHPMFDGSTQDFIENEDGNLIACETTIWRKDRSHPTKRMAYLSEYKRNTEPWKMEHLMLGHKSYKLTARYAFGLSGVFDEDDVDMINVSPASYEPMPTRDQIPHDPETGEIIDEHQNDQPSDDGPAQEFATDPQTGVTLDRFEETADLIIDDANRLENIIDYNSLASRAAEQLVGAPTVITNAVDKALFDAKNRIMGRAKK